MECGSPTILGTFVSSWSVIATDSLANIVARPRHLKSRGRSRLPATVCTKGRAEWRVCFVLFSWWQTRVLAYCARFVITVSRQQNCTQKHWCRGQSYEPYNCRPHVRTLYSMCRSSGRNPQLREHARHDANLLRSVGGQISGKRRRMSAGMNKTNR